MDSLGAAVDGTREAARLPREMELEVHPQQMLERLPCDLADGLLSDRREHGVPELGEQAREDPGESIWHEVSGFSALGSSTRDSSGLTSSNGPSCNDPDRRRLGEGEIEGVDDVLEEEGDLDVEELASNQQSKREDDSSLDAAVRSGPDVGDEAGEDRTVGEVLLL